MSVRFRVDLPTENGMIIVVALSSGCMTANPEITTQ